MRQEIVNCKLMNIGILDINGEWQYQLPISPDLLTIIVDLCVKLQCTIKRITLFKVFSDQSLVYQNFELQTRDVKGYYASKIVKNAFEN